MIPIGATVRWADKYHKNAPVMGVVTGHPAPRMVEVNGKGSISEGLLEVVGTMQHVDDYNDPVLKGLALESELTAAVAERDALRELVVAQAEANAELAGELSDMREALKDAEEERDAADEINAENLAGVREDFKRYEDEVTHRMEDLLLLFMGERRPVRPIEPPELRRLAEFVFEGV